MTFEMNESIGNEMEQDQLHLGGMFQRRKREKIKWEIKIEKGREMKERKAQQDQR